MTLDLPWFVKHDRDASRSIVTCAVLRDAFSSTCRTRHVIPRSDEAGFKEQRPENLLS